MNTVDVIVIGAGPAGLAAAIEARKSGASGVMIVERDREPGGILQQCIHNGFGLHIFGEELTGPEYAGRFIKQAVEAGVLIKLDTMVLSIEKSKTGIDVSTVNQTDGIVNYRAGAVVLAMGCRERSRGALNIPGSRPAGIYTAGAAQRFVNMEGCIPGKRIVILGSGDIGLIMARRMTLEGAKVLMVCELLPYSSGLNRNIAQCLEDYSIPLRLSHTVVRIHGKDRLEAVTVARVDENLRPVPESFEVVPCDTLMLSVGLIPENELSMEAGVRIDQSTGGPVVDDSMETSVEGLFACGNVLHVHDLVDYVTEESTIAGRNAALRSLGMKSGCKDVININPGYGVRGIVPQLIQKGQTKDSVRIFFRVDRIYLDKAIVLKQGDKTIYRRKKKKLAPGEMEQVTLGRDIIAGLNNADGLVISVG